MKYSTFEQAAIEANIGVKEIDAEIERLKARRDVLETLMRQISMALPMIGEEMEEQKAGAAPEIVASESSAGEEGLPEGKSRIDEWLSFISRHDTAKNGR